MWLQRGPLDCACALHFAPPEAEQTCFNCGKPGHRAKDCKLPDKRKQGNGSRALAVTDGQRDVFMGVVTYDVPIPLASFPLRQPGAQARRKQAAKQGTGVIGSRRAMILHAHYYITPIIFIISPR